MAASNSFSNWLDSDLSQLMSFAFGIGVILIGIVNVLKRQKRPLDVDDALNVESVLSLIKKRRTINPKDLLIANDDSDRRVTKYELDLMLEAANWAPTHGRTEPWRFVVFSTADDILKYLTFLDDWYQTHAEELPEEAMKTFRKKLESLMVVWPARLSFLVLIVMKRRALKEKEMPEWEEISATAMAVQNFQLMATALDDVGVLWSSHTWCKHARDSKELKKKFGFEDEDRILGALTVGRHAKGRKFTSTRGNIQHKVQYQ